MFFVFCFVSFFCFVFCFLFCFVFFFVLFLFCFFFVFVFVFVLFLFDLFLSLFFFLELVVSPRSYCEVINEPQCGELEEQEEGAGQAQKRRSWGETTPSRPKEEVVCYYFLFLYLRTCLDIENKNQINNLLDEITFLINKLFLINSKTDANGKCDCGGG